MTSSPFLDQEKGTLDLQQILSEAIPLVALIGLVATVALIPLAIMLTLGVLPIIFTILTQFILAVGAGIVLIYIIARGIQLAEA